MIDKIDKFKKIATKEGKRIAFQKEWDREIGPGIKAIQDHFPEESRKATAQKTEAALKKRAKRHEKYDKYTAHRPAAVKPASDKNLFGIQRSDEKVDKLTDKKQK